VAVSPWRVTRRKKLGDEASPQSSNIWIYGSVALEAEVPRIDLQGVGDRRRDGRGLEGLAVQCAAQAGISVAHAALAEGACNAVGRALDPGQDCRAEGEGLGWNLDGQTRVGASKWTKGKKGMNHEPEK